MAIASGTPVPPVYVMDNEQAINAFAAGTTPQNAVIGVTRGTIDTLTKVIGAFTAAGVDLLVEGARSDGGGRGVRLRDATAARSN